MTKLIFLIIIFSTHTLPCFANWLCREASSTRTGNTILACGVGQSEEQQESKDKARDSAVNEFKQICSIDDFCRLRQVQVNPKRTECIKKDSQVTCYRAIEFYITNKKKKDLLVNVERVRSKLTQKREELQNLQSHLYEIEKLKRSEKQLRNTQQKIERITGDTIELSRMISKGPLSRHEYKYTHLTYNHSIKTSAQYNGYVLTQSSENNLSFNLSYEKRFFRSLGIQVGVGFGGDFSSDLIKSDSEIPNTGIANSRESYVGSQAFREYGVSVVYYTPWWGTYIRGETGTIQYERKLYDVSYGPLGTKTGIVETKDKGSKSFVGGYFGFDSRHDLKGWGFYSEVGAKRINENVELSVTLGVNFGF